MWLERETHSSDLEEVHIMPKLVVFFVLYQYSNWLGIIVEQGKVGL